MTSKVVPLNKEQHKNLKLIPKINFGRFENMNSTTIAFQEFPMAAVELPIVFVKGKDGETVCVVLMGDKEPKNHYLLDGNPRGNFIPAAFSHYPLGITSNPENRDQIGILIDESSEFVSETEGEALFKEDGSETDYLQGRVQAMINYYNSMRSMKNFVDALLQHELLVPQGVKYGKDGVENEISGFFVVDEKKLSELSSDVHEDFRKKGFTPLIYAHLISLNNLNKLASYVGLEGKA